VGDVKLIWFRRQILASSKGLFDPPLMRLCFIFVSLASKCELQHLDPGRDFDMLIANNESQGRVGRVAWG
jgi:hypothetical protein